MKKMQYDKYRGKARPGQSPELFRSDVNKNIKAVFPNSASKLRCLVPMKDGNKTISMGCRSSAFTPVIVDPMYSKGNPVDGKFSKPKRTFKFHLENIQRKEMAVQKRLMANARERSRVHTLGAAFERLRQAIPSYSEDQKLSKLAVLRLAIYYIEALSDLNSNNPLSHFAISVNSCTRILNEERKSKNSKKLKATNDQDVMETGHD